MTTTIIPVDKGTSLVYLRTERGMDWYGILTETGSILSELDVVQGALPHEVLEQFELSLTIIPQPPAKRKIF